MLTDTPLSVADVLSKAADLIEPEGKWTQRVWGNLGTCMCAEGAIYAAVGSCPWVGVAIADKAADFLSDLLPVFGGNKIARWNDEPGRKQSEVVSKLREAATLARAEVQA